MKLSRFLRGQSKAEYSADGWPADADPFKAGTKVLLPNGRAYRVGPGGVWRRDREAEATMRDMQDKLEGR